MKTAAALILVNQKFPARANKFPAAILPASLGKHVPRVRLTVARANPRAANRGRAARGVPVRVDLKQEPVLTKINAAPRRIDPLNFKVAA